MIENLVPLKLPPGFYANGTRYQAKGRWNEGNLVRFHEGTIQPIGGWLSRATTGAPMQGVPLAAISWQTPDGTPFLAVGTTLGLYVIDANNVVFDITPAPGDTHTPPFDWQLSTFGAFLMAVNSLRGDDDTSLVNTYFWIGNTNVPAQPAWTSDIGPRGAYAAFATPERFLVMLRGQDPTTAPARSGVDTLYSERRVYWPSQEELAEFVATDTNTGGNFDLQTDGRLIVGAAARGQSLLWTDVDLWTMSYIGGELIYSFQNVGKQCGIVGRRAYVLLDKGAFWMGRGKFFSFDGFVRVLPCEVTDAVFGDFNEARASTVWALPNPRYNEITWFYPSAGAQYPDRYVTYNHVEGHWVFGALDRTAGVPQRFTRDVIDEPKPVMFNMARVMFDHETGNERDAQAYLTSGPVELGVGDRLGRLQGFMPDDRIVGDVNLKLYAAMAPDALETLHGPYTLGPLTAVRVTARQVRVRLEEATPSDWRVGAVRLAVRPAERRGTAPGAMDLTPASIEIVPSVVTLISSQHYTFQAIVRNAAGQVLDRKPDVWQSDNAPQVPVDTTGTVTGLATPATAHITARLLDPPLTSNVATVNVTGDNVPTSLTILPTPLNLVATFTQQMTYEFRNAIGQLLTGFVPDSWASTDETVATVDSDGLVTAIDAGTANISAALLDPPLTSNSVPCTVGNAWVIHTFPTGTNTFVVTSGSGDAEVLLVGGGGSGGSVDGSGVCAGGGGGGEVVHVPAFAVAPGTYDVRVGGGGLAPHADHTLASGTLAALTGGNGVDSIFGPLTARGGGGGGAGFTDNGFREHRQGRDGGSGGGGGSAFDTIAAPDNAGGASVASDGSGSAGGSGVNATPTSAGGGGGGAGGAGAPGDGTTGPSLGGPGLSFDTASADGTMREYGKGGNSQCFPATITAGANGTGNGGFGSGTAEGCDGGAGGAGTLIIKYQLSSGIVATGGVRVTIAET